MTVGIGQGLPGRYHPVVAAPPMFPLSTARLLVRALRASDAPVIHAYRNDPETARYQDWSLPFPMAAAERLVEEQAGVDRPLDGAWIQLAVEHAGELVGDLAVGLDRTGSTATVGYTLRPDRWGQGLGSEAVGALVDALFMRGTQRVVATIDPLNLRSARLLERLGFTYQGRAVGAAFVRGAWVDDDRYQVTPDERTSWLMRPRAAPIEVRLVEVTDANRARVAALATHHTQERFVAPVTRSFEEAAHPRTEGGAPVVPWVRAIEADGEITGFLMTAESRWQGESPYLWRLLIDRRHQGRGIGTRAVGSLVERLRAEGHPRLTVSWVRDLGGPEAFYLGLGFRLTGEIHEGEHVAELLLR
jgi:RimJ/RimL family protein N-acetyltransferase